MIIDILKLMSNNVRSIDFDITHSFTEEELKNTNIISLNDVHVVGRIYKDAMDSLAINCHISCVVIVPSSISLIPTDINIETDIDDLLENLMENVQNNQKTLDIFPIVWENILVEIPIRVENPKDSLLKEGNGWKVITKEENKVNPELAKLKDLL